MDLKQFHVEIQRADRHEEPGYTTVTPGKQRGSSTAARTFSKVARSTVKHTAGQTDSIYPFQIYMTDRQRLVGLLQSLDFLFPF